MVDFSSTLKCSIGTLKPKCCFIISLETHMVTNGSQCKDGCKLIHFRW